MIKKRIAASAFLSNQSSKPNQSLSTNQLLASHLVREVSGYLTGIELYALCQAFPQIEKNIRLMAEPVVKNRLGSAVSSPVPVFRSNRFKRHTTDPFLVEAHLSHPIFPIPQMRKSLFSVRLIDKVRFSPKGEHTIVLRTRFQMDDGPFVTYKLEALNRKGQAQNLIRPEDNPYVHSIHWLDHSRSFITGQRERVLLWQLGPQDKFSQAVIFNAPPNQNLVHATISGDGNLLFTFYRDGPATLTFKDNRDRFTQSKTLPYEYDSKAHIIPSGEIQTYQIVGNIDWRQFTVLNVHPDQKVSESYSHPSIALKYATSKNGLALTFIDDKEKLYVFRRQGQTNDWTELQLPGEVYLQVNEKSLFTFDDLGQQLALINQNQLMVIDINRKPDTLTVSVLQDGIASQFPALQHPIFLANGNELAVSDDTNVYIFRKKETGLSWHEHPYQKLKHVGHPLGTDAAGRRLLTVARDIDRAFKNISVFDRRLS